MASDVQRFQNKHPSRYLGPAGAHTSKHCEHRANANEVRSLFNQPTRLAAQCLALFSP